MERSNRESPKPGNIRKGRDPQKDFMGNDRNPKRKNIGEARERASKKYMISKQK